MSCEHCLLWKWNIIPTTPWCDSFWFWDSGLPSSPTDLDLEGFAYRYWIKLWIWINLPIWHADNTMRLWWSIVTRGPHLQAVMLKNIMQQLWMTPEMCMSLCTGFSCCSANLVFARVASLNWTCLQSLNSTGFPAECCQICMLNVR